jgi:hypothetical protein
MTSQPEIQPALRWLLLILICAAGWLWARRRFRTAALLFLVTQCGALVFWTSQLREPIALDGVVAMQEFWARIQVIHEAKDPGLGYVVGTHSPATLLTRAAALGLSPAFIQRSFGAAPVVLVVALAITGLCVTGSPARRWLTLVLAATSAPLWGLVVDLQGTALARPEATLLASLVLVPLAVSSRLLRFGRRPLWLAVVVLASLTLGVLLAGEYPGSESTPRDVLLVAVIPVFALMFVPFLRGLALALRSPSLNRTRLEGLLIVSIGMGSSWLWWDPARTIRGFGEARQAQSALDASFDWLKTHTSTGSVIASPPSYAALIAGHTGRQSLTAADPAAPGLDQPHRRARLYASLLSGQPDLELAKAFGVTHLFLGPGDADPPGGGMRRVFEDANDIRVFELASR